MDEQNTAAVAPPTRTLPRMPRPSDLKRKEERAAARAERTATPRKPRADKGIKRRKRRAPLDSVELAIKRFLSFYRATK